MATDFAAGRAFGAAAAVVVGAGRVATGFCGLLSINWLQSSAEAPVTSPMTIASAPMSLIPF